MIIIAIDPDVHTSGFCVLDTQIHSVVLQSLQFSDLLEAIYQLVMDGTNYPVRIVVEAGWLNAPNWHLLRGDSPAVVAKKGRAQGRNEQVGRCIYEYCEWLAAQMGEVEVKAVKPLRKCWKGRDRKITHQEITQFMPIEKKRTNQEERDAALLAWTEANFPMQIDMTNVFGVKSYLTLNG